MKKRFAGKVLAFLVLCALVLTSIPSVSVQAALPGGANTIVFVTRSTGNDNGHWYMNFGYWCSYNYTSGNACFGSQGRLCKYNVDTATLTTLLSDTGGSMRDPAVSYDGNKILFSYRPNGKDNYSLYTINADGTGLTRITYGMFDDFESTWLPSGDIMFVSSRSKRFTPCHNAYSGQIFRCTSTGQNIRIISGNIDQDNTPNVLANGRISYTRWEYVDRSQMVFHHLWIMNPDGTDQMVLHGNQYNNPGGGACVMLDARAIPGDPLKVAFIMSPGHGSGDHQGNIKTIDLKGGPDDTGSVVTVKSGSYTDVYPLTSTDFMAVDRSANKIIRVTSGGVQTDVWSNSFASCWIGEPRVLAARTVEPVIPDHTDGRNYTTGKFFMQNVYVGRNMGGVNTGDITKLMIFENLPKPINTDGNPPPVGFSSTYMVTRLLGTVPVESDGSAYFEAPANRPLSFVALDANDSSVQRMMSFTNVEPNERMSCIGCHEDRYETPRGGSLPIAAQRAASTITPVSGVPEIFDFQRDVQPILNQYCISCHSASNRQGGVILTGDYGPTFSLSYYNLMIKRQAFSGGQMERANYPPRTLGDVISPLMWKLGGRATDVTLTNAFRSDSTYPSLTTKGAQNHQSIGVPADKQKIIKYWINTGCQFAGTYASLGKTGTFPWMIQNGNQSWLSGISAVTTMTSTINTNCAGTCHTGDSAIPNSPESKQAYNGTGAFKSAGAQTDWSGIGDAGYTNVRYNKYANHMIYDLTTPADSVILKAPLAVAAGGYGLCVNGGNPVIPNTSDTKYVQILAGIQATKDKLASVMRWDMLDYKPYFQWTREMKRYKILPASYDPCDYPIDVYETEKRYWDSLQMKTGQTEYWGAENSTSGTAEETYLSDLKTFYDKDITVQHSYWSVAKNCTVTVSGGSNSSYAVNDNISDYWTADNSDSAWIKVDLGASYDVSGVNTAWNTFDYAKGYKIQTSTDNTNFTDRNTVTNGDGRNDYYELTTPVNCRYVKMLCTQRVNSNAIKLHEFRIFTPNLAKNRTAYASSTNASYPLANLNNADHYKRWAASTNDNNQWVTVDMGSSKTVGRARLLWYTDYCSGYKIQTSPDNTVWTDRYTTTTGNGADDDATFTAVSARYVRMQSTQRGTGSAPSLWEYELYVK